MQNLIETTKDFVRKSLENAEKGHDYFHTERVWKNAKEIAASISCNELVVELGALLHDIADPKFYGGDERIALTISEEFLKTLEVEEDLIEQVLFIIKNVSFKNRHEMPENPPVELLIVQDADRLDAIGAIGIARTFHFGGYKNNPMYDPATAPKLNQSKEEYKKSNGTTINHFYEKLLLLKDLMNTGRGKELARERHEFMEAFLEQFLKEWNAQK